MSGLLEISEDDYKGGQKLENVRELLDTTGDICVYQRGNSDIYVFQKAFGLAILGEKFNGNRFALEEDMSEYDPLPALKGAYPGYTYQGYNLEILTVGYDSILPQPEDFMAHIKAKVIEIKEQEKAGLPLAPPKLEEPSILEGSSTEVETSADEQIKATGGDSVFASKLPSGERKTSCDYLDDLECEEDYGKYIRTVLRKLTKEEKEEMLAFFKNFLKMKSLRMVRDLHNKFELLSVLVNDSADFEKALRVVTDPKYVPPLNDKPMNFSENIQKSAAMGRVPASHASGEVLYKINDSSLSCDALYLNPFVKEVQRVPVISDTGTVFHALMNLQVHDIMYDQIVETEGSEIAKTVGEKSALLKTLSKDFVNDLADVSLVQYSEDSHAIALRFGSQGAQVAGLDPEIIHRRAMKNLVYNLSFGQPSYFKVLYSCCLDQDFKSELRTKLRPLVKQRREASNRKQLVPEIIQARHDVLSKYVPSKTTIFGLADSKASIDPEKYQRQIELMSEVTKRTRMVCLADRQSFSNIYKMHSGDISETLAHRAVNDILAVNSDVVTVDAIEYVRTGKLLYDKTGRMRPNQYPDEDALVPTKVKLEFDQKVTPSETQGKGLFLVDYTNRNVIPHKISSYINEADMTTQREGYKEDRRAEIMLESTLDVGVKDQLDHILKQIKHCADKVAAKEYAFFNCGLIVPFSVFLKFKQAPIRYVMLAPFPNTSSFYVVFTSTPMKNYTAEHVLRLLECKRLSMIAQIDAFQFGYQDLHGLAMSRLRPKLEDPFIAYWFKNIFKPRYTVRLKKKYTPFVSKSKNFGKGAALREAYSQMNKLNMESLIEEKKSDDARAEDTIVDAGQFLKLANTWG